MASSRICSIPNCSNTIVGWELCGMHYQRLIRHGDTSYERPKGRGALWIEKHAGYNSEDCLKWPFGKMTNGYGKTWHKGKTVPASRVMCIVAHGDPPTPRHQAAHSCGKGHEGCINPKHLRWATPEENKSDLGIHMPDRFLSVEKVREIRRLAETISQRAIAKQFCVGQDEICRIVNRKRWAWVM